MPQQFYDKKLENLTTHISTIGMFLDSRAKKLHIFTTQNNLTWKEKNTVSFD
jgi:hypothetical protein